ncbi:MAG: rhodanese-like domain-containing protein [Balneolaceae bacterium]
MFNLFSRKSDGTDISPEEFKEMMADDRGVVIDVRTKAEYEEGHLAVTDDQLDVMNGEFTRALESLDKDKTYYLYCRSGNRSGQAARMMRNQGFDKSYNVGGYDQLVRAGFDSE